MAKIRSFRALRPAPELAQQIASPPYDVIDTEGARKLAEGNPVSFLHVVRPEIDLPEGTDPYADEVYAQAAANLKRLVADGALIQEEQPCLYLYAQQMGEHRQTGLVACCAVTDYDDNVIRKHEHTREKKELDRTRHVDTTNANTGPVFLTYRAEEALDALVDEALANEELLYDFNAPDGIGHTLHRVADEGRIARFVELFGDIPFLYVADGHHRSASAARVGRERTAAQGTTPGDAEHDWFMAVIFPHDQLRIMPYNRVVRDLNGLDAAGLIAAAAEHFEVKKLGECRDCCSKERRHIGMYLDGAWYCLRPKAGSFPADDPIESLDVAILQRNLLSPVLGIGDPRKDERIDFVGGIHGDAELVRRVDGGQFAVAFSMHPVSLDELMAIADANGVMPPKSTWFEPKLRSGLLVHDLG